MNVKTLTGPTRGQMKEAQTKERRFVFGLLLTWVLAHAVKTSLQEPDAWFRGFLFGLGDSLILVGGLYLIWNWIAEWRGLHCRGLLRKTVFALLLAWALIDAAWSAMEAPNALEASAWIGVLAFFLSFGWSLFFVVILYLVWNFVANHFQMHRLEIGRWLKGLYILLEFGLGGFITYKVLAIAIHAAGFIGGFVGLIFLPLTAMVAPIYEIVKFGNWWPVLFVYGGGLALLVLRAIPGITSELGHSAYTPPSSPAPVQAPIVTPAPVPLPAPVPTKHIDSSANFSLIEYIFSDIPYLSAGAEFSLDLLQSLNLSGWRGGVPDFTDSEMKAIQENFEAFSRTANAKEALFHPDAVEPLQRLFGGEALKELADSAWRLTGKLPKYWTPCASTYLKAWTITFDPLVLLALSELLALAGLKAEAKKAAEIVADLFPSYAPHYYGSSGVEGMRKAFAASRGGSDVTSHVAALARDALQTL